MSSTTKLTVTTPAHGGIAGTGATNPGAGSSDPAPGDWEGIDVLGVGSVTLSHVTGRYADNFVFGSTTGAVTVTSSTITHVYRVLSVSAGQVSVHDGTFVDVCGGVEAAAASLTVANNNVQLHSDSALKIITMQQKPSKIAEYARDVDQYEFLKAA